MPWQPVNELTANLDLSYGRFIFIKARHPRVVIKN